MGRGSIFLDVMRMPWWVGVASAFFVFLALQGILLFLPETQLGQAIRPAIQTLGYFFSGILLLGALISLVKQLVHSKRFSKVGSMSDIRGLPWRQFESFTAEAYRRKGYVVIETPEGPDNGIDLVLRKEGEKTYVQCKHWKANSVGVAVVRELLGSMTAGGAQNGVLVTSGKFTKAAKNLASECGISLVDGQALSVLISDVKAESNWSLSNQGEEPEISCPKCGSVMVIRVARRGPNKDGKFWGCTQFPKCRGVRQIM